MGVGQDAEPVGLDAQSRALRDERAHLGAKALRRPHGRGQPLRPATQAIDFVFGVAVEKVLDQLILIAAGEQLGRLVARSHLGRADELVRERGDRPRQRTGGRAADREREPVAKRRGRLARRGQHEQRIGIDARLDKCRDPRHERGRLAGARGADHDTGCRGRQCHDGALLRVQNTRHVGCATGVHGFDGSANDRQSERSPRAWRERARPPDRCRRVAMRTGIRAHEVPGLSPAAGGISRGDPHRHREHRP